MSRQIVAVVVVEDAEVRSLHYENIIKGKYDVINVFIDVFWNDEQY